MKEKLNKKRSWNKILNWKDHETKFKIEKIMKQQFKLKKIMKQK